jgi:hypothetical protein
MHKVGFQQKGEATKWDEVEVFRAKGVEYEGVHCLALIKIVGSGSVFVNTGKNVVNLALQVSILREQHHCIGWQRRRETGSISVNIISIHILVFEEITSVNYLTTTTVPGGRGFTVGFESVEMVRNSSE